MKRLLCRILGHRWRVRETGQRVCRRCGWVHGGWA
jgi:hypothetical protein